MTSTPANIPTEPTSTGTPTPTEPTTKKFAPMKLLVRKRNIVIGATLHCFFGEALAIFVTLLYFAYLMSPLNLYFNQQNIIKFKLPAMKDLNFYASLGISYLVAVFWWFPTVVFFVARLDRKNAVFYNVSSFLLGWLVRLCILTPFVAYTMVTNSAIQQGDTVSTLARSWHVYPWVLLALQSTVGITILALFIMLIVRLSRHAFIESDGAKEPISPEEIEKYLRAFEAADKKENDEDMIGGSDIPGLTALPGFRKAKITRAIILRAGKSPNNMSDIPNSLREKMMPPGKFRGYFMKAIALTLTLVAFTYCIPNLYPVVHVTGDPAFDEMFRTKYELVEPVLIPLAAALYVKILNRAILTFTKSHFVDKSKMRRVEEDFLYIGGAYLRDIEACLVIAYFWFLVINNAFFSRLIRTQTVDNEFYIFLFCLFILLIAVFFTIYKYSKHTLIAVGDRFCILSGNPPDSPGYTGMFTRYFVAVVVATPFAFLISQAVYRSIAALAAYLLTHTFLTTGGS